MEKKKIKKPAASKAIMIEQVMMGLTYDVEERSP